MPLIGRIFYDEPGSHFVGKCSMSLIGRIFYNEPGRHFVGKCS